MSLLGTEETKTKQNKTKDHVMTEVKIGVMMP